MLLWAVLLCVAAEVSAWRQYAPLPTLDDIHSVAFNTSSWSVVALSTQSVIYSSNQTDWHVTRLNVPTTSFSQAQLCYYEGKAGSFFLAVVDSKVLKSDDGVSFSTITDFSGQLLNGVHCSTGCSPSGACDQHIVVGAGFVAVASDESATTWKKQDIAQGITFTGATWTSSPSEYSLFYAVGGTDMSPSGSSAIYYATYSASSWTPLLVRDDIPPFTSVCASPKYVVAVGFSGLIAVSSTDNVGKFYLYFLDAPSDKNFKQIIYVPKGYGSYSETFFAISGDGTLFSSSDPSLKSSWNYFQAQDASFSSVAVSPIGAVLVGNAGSITAFRVDSFRTLSSVVTAGDFDGGASGPSAFAGPSGVLATVQGKAKTIFASINGSEWAEHAVGEDVHGLVFRAGYWWGAVGTSWTGGVAVSKDGAAWAVVRPQNTLMPVLFDTSLQAFVSVRGDGSGRYVVERSEDTQHWAAAGNLSIQGIANPQLTQNAAYGNGAYVLFVTWFDYQMNMSRSTLVQSTNGLAYTMIPQFSSLYSFYPSSLIFDENSKQFLLAVDNTVWTSTSPAHWVQHTIATRATIATLAASPAWVVAVLSSGEIIRADPAISSWTSWWNATNLAIYPGVSLSYASQADTWVLLSGKGGVYASR